MTAGLRFAPIVPLEEADRVVPVDNTDVTGLDLAREALLNLSARLARGEIDEATAHRQRDFLVSSLGAAERAELGLTPAPASPTPSIPAAGTPQPGGTPAPVSPR